ncbi:MAG: hypothetical protein ACXV3D_08970 [Halobacteriota archaeon]
MKKATIFALAVVVALLLFTSTNVAADGATTSTCPTTTSAQCTSCDTAACCSCPCPVICPTTTSPAVMSSVVTSCHPADPATPAPTKTVFDPY